MMASEEDLRAVVVATLRTIAPEVEEDELDDERLLREQVDLDSMDWLNFLVALHEKLHVEIKESDYAKLATLKDITAFLRNALS
jgi:acyl carrier protein